MIGLRGAPNFLDFPISFRKAYIQNLTPLVPFLHLEKFVMVGVNSSVNFKAKLTKILVPKMYSPKYVNTLHLDTTLSPPPAS